MHFTLYSLSSSISFLLFFLHFLSTFHAFSFLSLPNKNRLLKYPPIICHPRCPLVCPSLSPLHKPVCLHTTFISLKAVPSRKVVGRASKSQAYLPLDFPPDTHTKHFYPVFQPVFIPFQQAEHQKEKKDAHNKIAKK